MRKIEAVLFDCDGVLVDSEIKLRTQMHEALQEMSSNYNWSFDKFLHTVKGLDNPQVEEVLKNNKIEYPEDYFPKCDEFFVKEYHNFADKVEHVDQMLESLAEFPKVVCSNNWVCVYSKALERHDMTKHFKALLGQDVVEKRKPDPCVYLEGAKIAGVPIENCLAIEDTPGIGLQAATASNAGVVVGFTGSGSDAAELKEHGAHYTIDSLLELPRLIERLNAE